MKRWAILVFTGLAVSVLPACDDAVVGNCTGGLMGQIATYLVEVRYVDGGFNKPGNNFTVTASQNGQVKNSRTTDAGGFTMVYVMAAGPTTICATKAGFSTKCKPFEAVLGQVTLVHFTWQTQQLIEIIDPPIQIQDGR